MKRHIQILIASLSLAGALGLTVAGAVHSAAGQHQTQKTEAASSTPEGNPGVMFHG